MRYFEDYQVDGQPMLAPDADVAVSQSDLDSGDSGRDESGYMHRIVLRERVKTWGFQYTCLTAQEYRYMESLFAGKTEFVFTYRQPDGSIGSCVAYCSNHSITLRNAKTGTYGNYKFNIIQC